MVRRLGDHIHFIHLRSTKRDDAGNFFEADHLGGDVDMVAVIRELLAVQAAAAYLVADAARSWSPNAG